MKARTFNIVSGNPILKSLAPKVGLFTLAAKKISPDVMFVGGLIAGVAAGIMGAKVHKERQVDLADSREDIAFGREYLDAKRTDGDDATEPTQKEIAEVLAPAYGRLVGTYIRIYGPTLGMATLSIYLLAASHGIIKGRNKKLIATAQLLGRSFSIYRQRVREELGEEVDEKLLHGATDRSVVTVTTVDGKKKKKRTKENGIPEEYDPSIYTRIFDATSIEFSPDKDVNEFFLKATEQYMNDMLKIREFVLLNDVYDALHFTRTSEGCVVGWALGSGGDDFVDFGIDKPINKHIGDNRFVLDFNVNGVVFDYVGG